MKIAQLSPGERFITETKAPLEQTLVFQVSANPDTNHNAIHMGFLWHWDPAVKFGAGAKVFVNLTTEIQRI